MMARPTDRCSGTVGKLPAHNQQPRSSVAFRQMVLMLDRTGHVASRIIADWLRRHCGVRAVQLPAIVQANRCQRRRFERLQEVALPNRLPPG